MKVITLGGYSEVGMNMTALVVGDEVVIFDMGLYMPKIVGCEEEVEHLGEKEMIAAGAIPDDTMLEKYKDKVVGIFLSHAHLDHIGAVPYLANKYNCPVYASPYAMEILKKIIEDKGFRVKNKLKSINPNSKVRLSKNIEVEFVNVTHSTLQAVIIAVHTPEGSVLYANDFKLDNNPILGKKPNYARLKSFKNVKLLIVDSLYCGAGGKTPSEKVAREMLRDVLLGVNNEGKAVIVTTFSSHVARLKSIVDFGNKLKRKIVFIGRSLDKYVKAAIKLNLVKFSDVEIVKYGNQIKRKLRMISKGRRDKFMIVCTGNQAEPGSVLDRMVNGMFKFKNGDHVIFSCKTIPVAPNIRNREKMETKLKNKKVRLFVDVHVSGHCSREDLRDLVELVKPKHVIPTHTTNEMVKPMIDLAVDMGYKRNKTVHVMRDGKILKI